jgi:hypothetical protein
MHQTAKLLVIRNIGYRKMDLSTHFRSGAEMHIGDRISFAGEPGEIVFVIGRDEFEGEFAAQKDWFKSEYRHGFMLTCKSMGLVFQEEVDEDIQFVSRRGAE